MSEDRGPDISSPTHGRGPLDLRADTGAREGAHGHPDAGVHSSDSDPAGAGDSSPPPVAVDNGYVPRDGSGAAPNAASTRGEQGDSAAARPPRIKKLRLGLIVIAVVMLGLLSFVFGMFMAVASDLPTLENRAEFSTTRNSVLLDDQGRTLGVLTQQNRILVDQRDIPPIVKDAVISIEDRRFYSNNGIDVRGIGRAFGQDVLRKRAAQGASTITQQFVKNALQAQAHRTVFEKLRESALAYHLSRRWSKSKVITEYLNTIYFGNGAYGVEAAAHTYFGQDVNHQGCGANLARLCVRELKPWEAALLAGVIASPSAYDPVAHPVAAKHRRDQVLRAMLAQRFIDRQQYAQGTAQALPASRDVQPPREQSVKGLNTGYFNAWVRQQAIDRYGAQRALEGGLKIRTTLDLDLQRSAEQAVNNYLAATSGPTASVVAIDNATGQVRAMVGGRNYQASAFNLATQGQRQPGSAIKPFVLAEALRHHVSPTSVWSSQVKTFPIPHSSERFVVHNDDNRYSGSTTLTDATTFSDNSVYAEMGIMLGTEKIARLATSMGIRTPVSTNPAMTIGGLREGVTPLDMAHAYETLAHGGERVDSSLSPDVGPSGIQSVTAPSGLLPNGYRHEINQPQMTRILPADQVSTETSMLQTVVQSGTGKAADIGQFAAGKTGTTSDYSDAWFVGWGSKYTVAVWVGYPDRLKSMKYDFNGGPVLGGTFPALIWHDFMLSAAALDSSRTPQPTNNGGAGSGPSSSAPASGGTSSGPQGSTSSSSSGPAPPAPPSRGGAATGGGRSGAPAGAPAPRTPSPAPPTPHSSPVAPSGRSTGTGPSAPSGTGAGGGGTGHGGGGGAGAGAPTGGAGAGGR